VQAGRIHVEDLPFRLGGNAENAVSRGLRPVADDAQAHADHGVEQGGLAYVGATEQGYVAAAEVVVDDGIVFFGDIDVVHDFFSSKRRSTVSAASCSAARRLPPRPFDANRFRFVDRTADVEDLGVIFAVAVG